MTGLDTETDTIVEIACVVSSGDLRRVYQGPSIAIHHEDEVLERMNEWSLNQHTKSGLLAQSKESKVSMKDAEQQVLAFVKRHCLPQKAHLAGNSVHIDKAFLRKFMPELHDFFHFRVVDVSSVHELCRRWCPGKLQNKPKKTYAHTAMTDIMESIEELRYYKHFVFHLTDKVTPVVHPFSEHCPTT